MGEKRDVGCNDLNPVAVPIRQRRQSSLAGRPGRVPACQASDRLAGGGAARLSSPGSQLKKKPPRIKGHCTIAATLLTGEVRLNWVLARCVVG